MSAPLAVFAAVCGYAAGSVPFAVLVMRRFGGGRTLKETTLRVRGTDEVLRSAAVSATAVRLQLGARYGCLTSLLDMAKGAAVTLAFRLAYPHAPYFLIASGFAVVGHIWPIFHRFRGGRGQSPVIGSLFVVDWPTPLIAYPLAQILGVATRSRAYVGRFAPLLIAGAWLWLRFHDSSFIGYAFGLFVVRVVAMRDEIRQYARIRRSGALRSFADEAALLGYQEMVQGLALRIRQLFSRLGGR